MTKEILTQTRLKELLRYDPDTGIFVWQVSRNQNVSIGSVAGCLHKANGKSYIRIKVDKKSYYAHRLAVLYVKGMFPLNDIDHEDGNGLLNKWENIRVTDHSGNMKNRRLHKNNKLRINGIRFNNRLKKYHARVMVNKKAIHLGYFAELWDAMCSRKSADFKYNFHVNHGADRML